MDTIKKITEDRVNEIATIHGFNPTMIIKDYYITLILYLLKDVKGIYFKGGTALQKIFLNYSRLSEDADFTVIKNISEIRKEITEIIEKSGFFWKITKDKDVDDFLRLIAHYHNFLGEDNFVFIDLNKRAKLLLKPEKYKIKHFYKDSIPEFSFSTLAREEMAAEKMAATIGRNKPRDHYDLYKIIKAKMPINLEMVKKKCKQFGVEFNIIKMFNRAKKLKRRWDEDILSLLSEDISFQEVMKILSKHFKLKEEKEKLRDSK